MAKMLDSMLGQLVSNGTVSSLDPRQSVGGDPNNPSAANAAYMSDPVMQEKLRQNSGGRS